MGSPSGFLYVAGAARRFLRRVTTFRTVTILVYRFARRTLAPTPLDIRRVTSDNVDDARTMDEASRIEDFRSFLARGDEGYYVYSDGAVVHRSWVARGPRTAPLWHSYGKLAVGPNEVYIHYCETAPRARGAGIYPQVLARVAEEAVLRGADKVLIWTDANNQASQRGIVRAGFELEREVALSIRFGLAWEREGAAVPARRGVPVD